MGSDGQPVSPFADQQALTRALEIARTTEQADTDPAVLELLRRALAEIWTRINAAPHSYVLTPREFAIFNFFQGETSANVHAQSAVDRYWRHYRPNPSGVNGP
jgi:alkylation response protein AidB-like acyl-CoA dehydrogenase